MASGTGFKWIVKEAYPLYVATGMASLAFFGFLTRTVVSDPEIKFSRERRTNYWADEPEQITKVGERHYDHFIRRAFRGKEIGILPNSYFTRVD